MEKHATAAAFAGVDRALQRQLVVAGAVAIGAESIRVEHEHRRHAGRGFDRAG